MGNIILRTNAVPVYAFLSFINTIQHPDETFQKKKILDCGAGGAVPPLALFHQHGFEAWGIDTSDEQLERAKGFCDEEGLQLHLHKGDMRAIPFEDENFDYVYEHYSMCHLNKNDTALAIHEMYRVLKKQGLCFLGVISTDSWPRSLFGQERKPGEFWGKEQGDKLTLHSMFTDEETDQLVSTWEIVSKEKRVTYLREEAEKTTLEAWMEMYGEMRGKYPEETWQARYAHRANDFQYTHVYYLLRKPG
jgi:ubiquinone/menaquinone biosynthesis C-methylase UbiE